LLLLCVGDLVFGSDSATLHQLCHLDDM